MKSTRVTIPLRKGWRAGQHVRLRVLTMQMGVAAMLEVHPFTIASSNDDEEGLVLICKNAGNWTGSLAALARKTSSKDLEGTLLPSVRVIVQGPYGNSSMLSVN